jgi:hypothetical protein
MVLLRRTDVACWPGSTEKKALLREHPGGLEVPGHRISMFLIDPASVIGLRTDCQESV